MIAWMGGKGVALRAVGEIDVPVLPGRGITGGGPAAPAQADDGDDGIIAAATAQGLKEVVVHEGAGQHHLAWRMVVCRIERTGGDLVEQGGLVLWRSRAGQHSQGGGELRVGRARQVVPPAAGVHRSAA